MATYKPSTGTGLTPAQIAGKQPTIIKSNRVVYTAPRYLPSPNDIYVQDRAGNYTPVTRADPQNTNAAKGYFVKTVGGSFLPAQYSPSPKTQEPQVVTPSSAYLPAYNPDPVAEFDPNAPNTYAGGLVGPNGEPLPPGALFFTKQGDPYFGEQIEEFSAQGLAKAFVGWTMKMNYKLFGPAQPQVSLKEGQVEPGKPTTPGEYGQAVAQTASNVVTMASNAIHNVQNTGFVPFNLFSRAITEAVGLVFGTLFIAPQRVLGRAITASTLVRRGLSRDTAYAASLMDGTALANQGKLNDFVRQFEQEHKNPVLLAHELEDPLTELLYDTVTDPWTYIGIGQFISGLKNGKYIKNFNALSAITDDLAAVAKTYDGSVDAGKAVLAAVDIAKAPRVGWLDDLSKSIGARTQVSTAKVNAVTDLMKRTFTAAIMGDPDKNASEVARLAQDLAILSRSTDEGQRLAALSNIMASRARNVLLSPAGLETGEVFADLMFEGTTFRQRGSQIVAKWADEIAELPREQQATAWMEKFAESSENLAELRFPSVLTREKLQADIARLKASGIAEEDLPAYLKRFVGDDIPKWMLQAAKTHQQLQKVVGPVNKILGLTFIRANPAVWARNYMMDGFIAFIDQPRTVQFMGKYATNEALIRAWTGGTSRLQSAGFAQVLSAIPGQEQAIPKGPKAWKWLTSRMEAVEANTAARVSIAAIDEAARSGIKGIVRGHAAEIRAAGLDVRQVEKLLYQNKLDWAATVRALGGNDARLRVLSNLSDELHDFAVNYQLMDDLRAATTIQDAEERARAFQAIKDRVEETIQMGLRSHDKAIMSEMVEADYAQDLIANMSKADVNLFSARAALNRRTVEMVNEAATDLRRVALTSVQGDPNLSVQIENAWALRRRALDELQRSTYGVTTKLREAVLRAPDEIRPLAWDEYFLRSDVAKNYSFKYLQTPGTLPDGTPLPASRDAIYVILRDAQVEIDVEFAEQIKKLVPGVDDMMFQDAMKQVDLARQVDVVQSEREAAKLLAQAPEAAGAGEPVLRPGFTRLYRGEGTPSGAKVPDWAKDTQGQWWTTNRSKAQRFATGGQPVRYVDVPEEKLAQYRAPEGTAADEYLVHQDTVKNLGGGQLAPEAAGAGKVAEEAPKVVEVANPHIAQVGKGPNALPPEVPRLPGESDELYQLRRSRDDAIFLRDQMRYEAELKGTDAQTLWGDRWIEGQKEVKGKSIRYSVEAKKLGAKTVPAKPYRTPKAPESPIDNLPDEVRLAMVNAADDLQPTVGQAYANAADDIRKNLDAIFQQVESDLASGTGRITPEQQALLEAITPDIERQAVQVRAVASEFADSMRTFTLHDYGDKRGFDGALAYIFPYQYWYSRSYYKWVQRLATQPWIGAAYMRYKDTLAHLHAGLPEWWKYTVNTNELFGLKSDNPLYFNLEQNLFPLYGLTGVDFNDPDRKHGWFASMLDGIGKFGPSVWAPFAWATAAVYGLAGDTDAAKAWAGRLIPQTNTIKAITGLAGVQGTRRMVTPTGLELDPLMWLQGGTSKYEDRAIGRMLGRMEQEGVPAAQIRDAAYTRSGPIWEMAAQRVVQERAPGQIAGQFFGWSARPRSAEDAAVDQFYQEMFALMARKDRLTPVEYSQAWQVLRERFPFAETILLSRKSGIERDEALSWGVINRIPPGRTRDLAEDVGLDPRLLDKFYESKGDLTGWEETDRQRFLAAIGDLGATLDVPPTATSHEWSMAKDQYSVMQTEAKALFGENVLDVVDGYYALKDDRDASNQYLHNNPVVGQYLDWKSQRILDDPLLSRYYGGLDFLESFLKSQLYTRAEAKFGEDIWNTQSIYYEIKDKGGAYSKYREDHPELVEFWNFLDEGKQEIAKHIAEFGDTLPEVPQPFIRADAARNTIGAIDVLNGIQDVQPADVRRTSEVLAYTSIPNETKWSLTGYIEAQAEGRWPGVVKKNDQYEEILASSPAQAASYLSENPDVAMFREWERAYRANYNRMAKYGPEANRLEPEQLQISLPPAAQRLLDDVRAGEELPQSMEEYLSLLGITQ